MLTADRIFKGLEDKEAHDVLVGVVEVKHTLTGRLGGEAVDH